MGQSCGPTCRTRRGTTRTLWCDFVEYGRPTHSVSDSSSMSDQHTRWYPILWYPTLCYLTLCYLTLCYRGLTLCESEATRLSAVYSTKGHCTLKIDTEVDQHTLCVQICWFSIMMLKSPGNVCLAAVVYACIPCVYLGIYLKKSTKLVIFDNKNAEIAWKHVFNSRCVCILCIHVYLENPRVGIQKNKTNSKRCWNRPETCV